MALPGLRLLQAINDLDEPFRYGLLAELERIIEHAQALAELGLNRPAQARRDVWVEEVRPARWGMRTKPAGSAFCIVIHEDRPSGGVRALPSWRGTGRRKPRPRTTLQAIGRSARAGP